jgi:AraC family transcriptional regulator of arabinose operon
MGDTYRQRACAILDYFTSGEMQPQGTQHPTGSADSVFRTADLRDLQRRIEREPAVASASRAVREQWQAQLSDPTRPFTATDLQQMLHDLMARIDRGVLFNGKLVCGFGAMSRSELGSRRTRFDVSMPCWTLHVTARGSALYIGQGWEQLCNPGDIILVPPDTPCQQGIHPQADAWEHYWALFTPRPHWLNWLKSDRAAGISSIRVSSALLEDTVIPLMQQIARDAADTPLIADDLAMNSLEQLLLRLRPEQQSAPASDTDTRILALCNLMLADLSRRYSASELAQHCHLSTSRLSHLFREQMGTSLKSWYEQQRMQLARHELAFTDASIARIAAAVGYSDQLQFSRRFRANIGCSPSAFRASYRPS